MEDNGVSMRVVRKSIDTQLREWCEANGHTFETGRFDDGRIAYIVDGEKLPPGEAADKWLPGGFKANFGRLIL